MARATSARWASGCSWAWACAAWRSRRSCARGASWGGCCSRRVRAPARRPGPAAAGRCNLGRCRQAGRDSAACPQRPQTRERQTAAGRPARGTPAPTPRASCASHAGAPGGRAGQDEGIVRGAMLYLYLSLPALWCYSVVECVKRYLLSQARPRAAAPWSRQSRSQGGCAGRHAAAQPRLRACRTCALQSGLGQRAGRPRSRQRHGRARAGRQADA